MLDIPAPRVHHRGKLHDSPVWISSNERTPRMAVAAKTTKWIQATTQALADQYPVVPKQFQNRVLITGRIYKPTNNRYDPMNLYPTGKAIVDALTRAGILHDDDWTHVLGPLMDHGGKTPRGSEHIHITIEELR
jgi:hypothetical protein